MNIPVPVNAPVRSIAQIEIEAPVKKVWEVLTRIDNWPQWQKPVKEARLMGELKEGVEFRWKAAGLSFVSIVHTIVPENEFGWTGKTLGTHAVHNWTFVEKGRTTVVLVEESLQGFLPAILKKYFQKNLDQGMKNSLQELKLASETGR